MTHGARSERVIQPLATVVEAEIVAAAPWLSSPAFSAARQAFSRNEARIQLLSMWLDEVGMLDTNGQPRPAAELLVRLERLGLDLRGRLGLSPDSFAKIRRDLAASESNLAEMLARAAEDHHAD